MVRRPPELAVAPLLGALAEPARDALSERILDATVAVLATGGLRHCTVEEIAARGRLGRTTIYRRFDGRDALVHAALARELQRFFAAIAVGVGHLDRLEDQVVEGFLAGVRALDSSPISGLLRSEPELLALVTSEGGAVVGVAADALVDQLRRTTGQPPPRRAREVAEVLVRLALTFVLMPQSALGLHDDRTARASLHAIVDPLVGAAP